MTDQAEKFNNASALGGHAADQLRSYTARIERLDNEINELNDDKCEVYREVKACGFDKKVLRTVIRRRRKDKTDINDEDSLVALYEEVLAIRPRETSVKDPFD